MSFEVDENSRKPVLSAISGSEKSFVAVWVCSSSVISSPDISSTPNYRCAGNTSLPRYVCTCFIVWQPQVLVACSLFALVPCWWIHLYPSKFFICCIFVECVIFLMALCFSSTLKFAFFFLFSLPADIISTVEFNHTGELLATGDKGGRVVIFQREPEVCELTAC